jgi:hypothetical protein
MTRRSVLITHVAPALLFILLGLAALYGAYWVVKHVSYSLFYRSMVERTVRDMVKPSALRDAP